MKKERMKGFLSGILVSILCFTLIGTAAATIGKRTLEVDYKNLTIDIDGKTISPTDATGKPVEPFAYQGTTYVPVRAVAEAMGATVSYYDFSEGGVITITSAEAALPALNNDYQDSGVPRFDKVVGYKAFYDSVSKKTGVTMYIYVPDYFKRFPNDYDELYKDLLEYHGFTLSQTDDANTGHPTYHFTNKETNVWVSLKTHSEENPFVYVMVDTTEQKAPSSSSGSKPSSSGNTSSPSSSSSAPSGNTSSPSTTPSSSDKDEQYRQAYIDKRMAEKAAREKYGPDSIPESAQLKIDADYKNALNQIENQ